MPAAPSQFISQNGQRKKRSSGNAVGRAAGVAGGPLSAGMAPASKNTNPTQNSTQTAGGQIFGWRRRV